MTLYLKYRPQKLSDIDIRSVRESISKILLSGKIPHAFLFSGTKGTGKTSTARIVAKYVNCQAKKSKDKLPCNECESCISITKGENLDVIEIDAASHRGIDDIRTLRETIKLSPFKSKYKVYIIDECHMLTTEAANALLKTLEEPPNHVIFILATTNPEKLLPTILSRCVIINFTKAKAEEIVGRLKLISKKESVNYTTEALQLIAQVADGSFRDAVKKLEQCIVENISLDYESVSQYLFHSRDFSPSKIIELIYLGQTKECLDLIERSLDLGVTAKTMLEILLKYLRDMVLARTEGKDEILPDIGMQELLSYVDLLLDASRDMSVSSIEQLPLEIFVIKASRLRKNLADEKISSDELQSKDKTLELADGNAYIQKSLNQNHTTSSSLNSSSNHEDEIGLSNNSVSKIQDTIDKDSGNENGSKSALKFSVEKTKKVSEHLNGKVRELSSVEWQTVLTKIRLINSSTEALLRVAKPISYDGQNLLIGVYYKFHKERLESKPHKDIVYKAIEDTFGVLEKVDCVLIDPPVDIIGQKAGQVSYPSTSASEYSSSKNVVLTEAQEVDIVNAAKELFGS